MGVGDPRGVKLRDFGEPRSVTREEVVVFKLEVERSRSARSARKRNARGDPSDAGGEADWLEDSLVRPRSSGPSEYSFNPEGTDLEKALGTGSSFGAGDEWKVGS